MGIFAPFQRMDTGGICHILVRNLMNAPSRFFDGQTQSVGNLCLNSLARRGQIQLHLAAQKETGIQIAQHQIGVGDGWLGATAAVTSRAWVSARRIRPHLEQAQRINTGNRAAAGADLDHLDHRDLHRQPRAFFEAVDAIHLEVMGNQRFALVDHTEFGRGAPHVKGEQIGATRKPTAVRRRQRPSRRPRFK